MAEDKTEGSVVALSDLSCDVLMLIHKNLDDKSQHSLIQVCKALRDKLYDPIFWTNKVLKLASISMATVTSLKTRGITKIKLDEDAVTFRSALVSQGMLDNIETMICTRKQLVGLRRNSALKSNFVSLKCLVLDIKFLNQEKANGAKSELESFFAMLENLTGLHIYVREEGTRGRLSLLEIILRNLPRLKDLVIDRSRHGNAVDFRPGRRSHHSIERFSCTKIPGKAMRPLLQRMPNLRYLDLQKGISNFDVQGSFAFSSVQSFTLNCVESGRWDNFPVFMSALPNLYALDLRCGSAENVQNCIHRSVDVDFLCSVAKSCTKLTVLHLPEVFVTSQSATKLIDILVQLQELRVLSLLGELTQELRSCLPYFAESAASKLPKLESLLGVTGEEIDSILSLKYKSGKSVGEERWHILQRKDNESDNAVTGGETPSKRKRVSMWVPVKDEVTLGKARGTDFFYPASSVPYRQLTESAMGEIFCDDDCDFGMDDWGDSRNDYCDLGYDDEDDYSGRNMLDYI